MLEPWKVEERGWLGESPGQALENPGGMLDSLKESPLIPPNLKIYGGLSRISGQLLLEPSCPLHPQGCIISLHPNKSCRGTSTSPTCDNSFLAMLREPIFTTNSSIIQFRFSHCIYLSYHSSFIQYMYFCQGHSLYKSQSPQLNVEVLIPATWEYNLI